jgi:Sulfotransferase domain
MSSFEVQELSWSLSKSTFGKHFLVKPKDEKWKNFPPCSVPKQFLDVLDKVKDFQVFDDDVFLTGYPRSGTTIAAEMLWLIANNFDFEKATSLVTDDRVPGLE